MYKLIKQNNQFQNAQYEYICDELNDLNGVNAPFGSKAYCINDSTWQILNGSDEWVQAAEGSSGGGSSSSQIRTISVTAADELFQKYSISDLMNVYDNGQITTAKFDIPDAGIKLCGAFRNSVNEFVLTGAQYDSTDGWVAISIVYDGTTGNITSALGLFMGNTLDLTQPTSSVTVSDLGITIYYSGTQEISQNLVADLPVVEQHEPTNT